MTTTIILTDIADTHVETCMGNVRWVPLSSMQAHRRKLQQLFAVQTYRDGRVIGVTQEWRDVPDGDY